MDIKKFLAALAAVACVVCGCSDGGIARVFDVSDASAQAAFSARGENFKAAFDFINTHGVEGLKKMNGKVQIAGDKVYANISDIQLKPITEQPVFEAHNKFADIHLILEGEETIGVKNRADCANITTDKLAESDYILFKEKPAELLKLGAGKFTVFLPGDAHAPSLGVGKVRKCVIKVAVK